MQQTKFKKQNSKELQDFPEFEKRSKCPIIFLGDVMVQDYSYHEEPTAELKKGLKHFENQMLLTQGCRIEEQNLKNQAIAEILTVNGARFTLEDGSWGLVRASSNKPSLVVVTESTHSDSTSQTLFWALKF